MDRRRWWLLVGAAPVVIACAIAAAVPALRPIGDDAVAAAALAASVVLWVAARGHSDRLGWRLLAAAPLLPVAGVVLGAVVAPTDRVQLVVLRWAPTVPGYLLAIVGVLTLAGLPRLRAAGLRSVVEAALFLSAGLLVVQLLMVGIDGSWAVFDLDERLILGGAALVTCATMAATLVVLGLIDAHRRLMALALLVGSVLLTFGRALGTSAVLSGAAGILDVCRFLIVAGLGMLVTASLIDPGRDPEAASADDAPAAARSSALGQMLPHLAMGVAAIVIGAVAASGREPSRVTLAGIVVVASLAVLHRWVSTRDERRLAARLTRSEAYFRSLVRSSGDAVVILDAGLRVTWTSAALERALGTASAELRGRPLVETVHPDDVRAVTAALIAPAPGSGLLLLRLRDAEGAWRYLEAAVSDLREHADVGAVVLHCRDMTERQAREEELAAVAYTDLLTGLPNRAGFQQLLATAIAAPEGEPATLLFIELEGLSAARDATGRETVQAAVTEVGRRLRATVRGEDVVARLGGGAFAVLTHGDAADADQVAARCHAVVEQPVTTPTGLVDLTAAIGLVDLESGLTIDDLLGRADLALRQARATGPGSSTRYSAALGTAAARREKLRSELMGACARGELSLLFEPVVSLGEQKVTGLEALVRWRHPTLGDVPPSEFLPIAEISGLMSVLVRWVLETATSAIAALPAETVDLQLGVNVPAGYLATGMLVADVQHALQTSGLPAERLILEISDSIVLSEDDRIALDLSTLRLMGLHVALDGFGTGESALGHLTQLPIDVLKLDRALISRIDRDLQSRALCESIIGIGKALNLDVVAEGVETTGQLAALSGFGCGFAQGFIISRPMPLTALLSALGAGAQQLWPGVVSRV